MAEFGRRIAERQRRGVWDELGARRELHDLEDFSTFVRSLASESDRAVPIIFLAYIDTQMESMLREEINPSVPGGIEGLFQPEGLLGTFGARIKLCQAIGWISDELARDLDLLRKVRNEFAHNPTAAFDSERVRGWLSSLHFLRELMKMAPTFEPQVFSKEEGWFLHGDDRLPRTPRLDFTLAAAFALQQVATELFVYPTALKSGFAKEVFLHARDEQPEWFSNHTGRAPAVLILAVLDTEAARLGLRILGEPS